MGFARLHHTRREVLQRDGQDWGKLDFDAQSFISSVVDVSAGHLSLGKWNKLYAILAQLAQETQINYRVYLSAEGYLYDTTSHALTTRENLDEEVTHDEVVDMLIGDEQETRLCRMRFEIEQISLKIEHLVRKRQRLTERHRLAYKAFMGRV